MKTIKLNMQDVVIKAREAYDAGLLQAQNQDKQHAGECSYAGPCAIGVSLPADQRERFDNPRKWLGDTSIDSLSRQGAIAFETAEELSDATDLQISHDNWVGSAGSMREKDFVERLTHLEDKYGVRNEKAS